MIKRIAELQVNSANKLDTDASGYVTVGNPDDCKQIFLDCLRIVFLISGVMYLER